MSDHCTCPLNPMAHDPYFNCAFCEERQHREGQIAEAIDAFNADDSRTHRSNPDSREHYYARRPILATDCDYEIVSFSGVQAKWIDA